MKRINTTFLKVACCICILAIFVIAGRHIASQALIASESVDKEPPTAEISDVAIEPVDKSEIIQNPQKNNSAASTAPLVGTNLGVESEPNNTSADADSLGTDPEGKIKGFIAPNGDVDFYSFTTTQPNTRVYAATMTAYSASASVDSFLEIRDSDGTTVLEADNDDGSFGTTSSSIAGLNLPAAGTYYVFVRHNLATAQLRPYDLYISTRSAAPTGETEANDTSGTANPVPASGHISGATASTADQDWFSITLNAGDTIYASLDMDPERDTTTWNGGLGVAIFNGFVLTVNDGNLTSPNSEVHQMTVRDAGTYFVRVAAPTGGTTFGTYNLNVTVIPRIDSSGGCTTYMSTDVPQVIPTGPGMVSSTLTVPGNPRIEKMRVLIGLDHTFMNDLDVHLRSPAGNDNGLFTDIGNATSGPPAGLGDMDITLDDDFGTTINSYTVQSPIGWKPELNYRLDWFHGENAGGVWTLDIRDDATGDGGTLNSWGIEVCEAPAPAGTVVFTTDFESNDGGYTHSGTADEWEYGTPNTVATTTTNPVAGFTTCNSGTNCWKTDLDNTYNASSNQDLVSPNIVLPATVNPITLSWAMRYQMESANFDHAYVTVTEVGNPANTRRVWEWTGATMTNAPGNPAVNIPASAGWGTYNADISDFANKTVQVTFHLDSDTTVNFGGMAIDDVTVRANLMPGTLQFDSATYSVGEDGGMATLTVTRTGGSEGAVSVDYSLGGGTATGGASCGGMTDYVNAGGTVMFADGETSKTIDVPICDDMDVEPDETFDVTLSNATGGATIGTPNPATVTINDNDMVATCSTMGPIEVVSTGGTTTPTAYATIKDAFDAINAGTHTGSINIKVCGNTTETASAILDASGTGSSSYTDVTIHPVGGAWVIEGSFTGAIIKLNGADNVTIDGRQGGTGTARDLTVRNNSTAAATAAVWLSSVAAGNGASNNTVRNLELATGIDTSTSGNATFGIIMSGTTISVTSNGVDNDNNQFIFNRIIKARYGIVTRGTTTNLNIAPVVTDNIIGANSFGTDQISKVGILMQADSGAVVSRNIVQNVGCLEPQACTGSDRIGIAIGTETWSATDTTSLTSLNYTVTKNIVHDVIEENTFSAAGIRVGTTQSGGTTGNLVANNFVYNIRANSTSPDQVVGIGVSAGNGDSVVFNSISLTGDMDPGVSTDSTIFGNAMRIPGANGSNNANFSVMNNSIYLDVNSDLATTHYYAITLNSAAYSFGTGGLNYNNYYINQANPQLRTGGLASAAAAAAPSEFQTLANWQGALTTPQDANSIQADPLYFSNTGDLHIPTNSPNVNVGLNIGGITDDIDGDMRPDGASSDIGADESLPSPGSVQLSASSYSVNETDGTVTVTVTRSGGSNGTASVDYMTGGGTATGGGSCGGSVDYVTTSGTLMWADLDAAPKMFTVPICADGMLEGLETFGVTLSNAMGATLGTPSMATVTITDAGSTINGTINVGTGEAITSLTNPGGIFDAINNGTVTGNVTINITSDLAGETGAVLLNEIAGGFTVTIKPSGEPRTITGTAPATGGMIGFNSADNVTIDGSLSGGTDRSLTIMPSNTANNGGGIYFASGANGAQNNTVKNVNVWGNGNTTGVLLGVAFASSTFGGLGVDNDNNQIINNDIRGAFYGIAHLGASTANKDTGTVISDNVMPGITTAGIGRVGIYVFANDGAMITGNNIASVFNPGGVDSVGIAAGSQNLSATPLASGSVSNATVSGNSIGVVSNNATFSAAGIVLASDTTGTNTVVNNMVSGVIGNSNAGDIVAGIYVHPVAGATQNIYHNSVSMTGDRGSATANMLPSFALAISNDQPVNVVNNILVNSQTRTGATGGGGESYAIGFDGPAANANLMSNYNDLFVSGPLGVVGITGDLTTPAQTTTAGTGTNRATLMDWQTATGEDANSISVDPLFVSTTDLHLQMGSPAINAGTNVGVTTDIDGETRDAMPDIGADEVPAPPAPGTLQFSNAIYSGGEGGSPFTVTVTRENGTSGTVTVDYATSDGTATGGASCTAGIDYVSTSGTLTFLDGETMKTFDVTICDDSEDEPDETINYTLSNPTGGATIGTPGTAVQTIVDNDESPAMFAFTISDVKVVEGDSGMVNAVFNVTLASIMTNNVGGTIASVQYSTANGTATAGSDYATTSGTLNFSSTGTMTVSVPVNGDTTKESNEFFFVNLSNPSMNAIITDGQGAGIIVDEDRPYVADYDRDLMTDFSVYRPSNSTFYVSKSTKGFPIFQTMGMTGDISVPGDYDGDGKVDFALFRPSTGDWTVLRSSDNTTTVNNWGVGTDKPVQGDYDGDGKTDLAVYRPSEGNWYILPSGTGVFYTVNFGISTDRLVQADYDGDFKTDVAVYRDGTWYALRSSDSSVLIQNWGLAADIPVVGDFDSDGRNDLTVYRDGDWYIFRSLTNDFVGLSWGIAGDIPVPADYDGDGTSDVAVFRPSGGDWYVIKSSDSTFLGFHWGQTGDKPSPAAYLPQ